MNDDNDPIGIAELGDAVSELWVPDDYDLIIILDGELIGE